jgi:hypothetical protein
VEEEMKIAALEQRNAELEAETAALRAKSRRLEEA